jgi:hypothetical protein
VSGIVICDFELPPDEIVWHRAQVRVRVQAESARDADKIGGMAKESDFCLQHLSQWIVTLPVGVIATVARFE